jgi:hypothetical protein
MNESELARLEQLGRRIEQGGECIFRQLNYENEICKLTEKLSRWTVAFTRAQNINPKHPLLLRAKKTIAEFTTNLDALRYLFLKSWRPDRRHPN